MTGSPKSEELPRHLHKRNTRRHEYHLVKMMCPEANIMPPLKTNTPVLQASDRPPNQCSWWERRLSTRPFLSSSILKSDTSIYNQKLSQAKQNHNYLAFKSDCKVRMTNENKTFICLP